MKYDTFGCMFGLRVLNSNGELSKLLRKAWTFVVSHSDLGKALSRKCNHSPNEHDRIQGDLTKQSENYPVELCSVFHNIFRALIDRSHLPICNVAFASCAMPTNWERRADGDSSSSDSEHILAPGVSMTRSTPESSPSMSPAINPMLRPGQCSSHGARRLFGCPECTELEKQFRAWQSQRLRTNAADSIESNAPASAMSSATRTHLRARGLSASVVALRGDNVADLPSQPAPEPPTSDDMDTTQTRAEPASSSSGFVISGAAATGSHNRTFATSSAQHSLLSEEDELELHYMAQMLTDGEGVDVTQVLSNPLVKAVLNNPHYASHSFMETFRDAQAKDLARNWPLPADAHARLPVSNVPVRTSGQMSSDPSIKRVRTHSPAPGVPSNTAAQVAMLSSMDAFPPALPAVAPVVDPVVAFRGDNVSTTGTTLDLALVDAPMDIADGPPSVDDSASVLSVPSSDRFAPVCGHAMCAEPEPLYSVSIPEFQDNGNHGLERPDTWKLELAPDNPERRGSLDLQKQYQKLRNTVWRAAEKNFLTLDASLQDESHREIHQLHNFNRLVELYDPGRTQWWNRHKGLILFYHAQSGLWFVCVFLPMTHCWRWACLALQSHYLLSVPDGILLGGTPSPIYPVYQVTIGFDSKWRCYPTTTHGHQTLRDIVLLLGGTDAHVVKVEPDEWLSNGAMSKRVEQHWTDTPADAAAYDEILLDGDTLPFDVPINQPQPQQNQPLHFPPRLSHAQPRSQLPTSVHNMVPVLGEDRWLPTNWRNGHYPHLLGDHDENICKLDRLLRTSKPCTVPRLIEDGTMFIVMAKKSQWGMIPFCCACQQWDCGNHMGSNRHNSSIRYILWPIMTCSWILGPLSSTSIGILLMSFRSPI